MTKGDDMMWRETWETPEWARARLDALERIAIALERIAAAEEGRIASIRRLEERQDRLDEMAEELEHALAEEQMEGERWPTAGSCPCTRVGNDLNREGDEDAMGELRENGDGTLTYASDEGKEIRIDLRAWLDETPRCTFQLVLDCQNVIWEETGEMFFPDDHPEFGPHVLGCLLDLEDRGEAVMQWEGVVQYWSKP